MKVGDVEDAKELFTASMGAGPEVNYNLGIIATVASLMTNKIFFSILIFVDLAVLTLIAHYLYNVSAVPAGVFLLLTSVFSFYGASAILLNTMANKTILPLGNSIWKP